MATTPEDTKAQAPAKVAEHEKAMHAELATVKAELAKANKALEAKDDNLKKLEARVENQAKMLKREERRAEGHRRAAEGLVEGLTPLAQERAEKREEIRKAAKVVGTGPKAVKLYRVRGEPAYRNLEGRLYPVGSVIRLGVDENPSVNWVPIGAEVDGETDEGHAEVDGDENALTMAQARGPAAPKTGASAPHSPRPSDTKVA